MNTLTIKKSRTTLVYALGMALLCGAARAEEPVGVEAEGADDESALEFGVDFDWFTAYVWRNAVQNDQMVLQPGVWADFTFADSFSIGGSVWQNYDVTSRRREAYRTGLNETDFNLHLGWAAWTSEDEECALTFEFGHEWYLYHNVRGGEDYAKADYPNTREIYVKAEFENPFVNIYGQASWMYENFGAYKQGMHYETGLTKEIEFADGWTLGADWNINFGDGHYLQFLYGDVNYRYDAVTNEEYSDGPKGGIGGTTVKGYLAWQITSWLSLKGMVGYTAILHNRLRGEMRNLSGDYWFCGEEDAAYPRDLVWGGLSLNMEF